MTLDDLPNDPALRPSALQPPSTDGPRVLFREGSAFARDFGFPPGASGVVVDRYRWEDGEERASLLVEGVPGVGYATGVPVRELWRV